MHCVDGKLVPVFGTFGFINLIGHSTVLFRIVNTGKLRNSCFVFLANLAVADLLMGLTLLPLSLSAKVLQERDINCTHIQTAAEFIEYTSLMASVLFIVMLAFDRYMACLDAFRHQRILTRRNSCIISLFCWCVCMFLSGSCLIEDASDLPTPFIRERTSSDVLHALFVIIGFAMVAVVQTYLYRESRKHIHRITRDIKQVHGGTKSDFVAMKKNLKLLLTILVLSAAYGICLVPFSFVKVARLLGCHSTLCQQLTTIVAPLTPLNGALNPWIYMFTFRDFRQAMRRKINTLLPCVCGKRSNRVSPAD